MKTLLEKTRKINELLQKPSLLNPTNDLPYDKMAEVLSDIINANAYIISEAGVLLGYHEQRKYSSQRFMEMVDHRKFPEEYTDGLSILRKTDANIPVTNDLTIFPSELCEQFPNGLTTISPIFATGKRLGSIILGREDDVFEENELVLIEYSATVVGMQILYQQSRTREADIRQQTALSLAMNTLSYSELKAVQAILGELGGDEGRLTASQIADDIGITRSVIVNALRKLESAGIIESRSLGMKGTFIKVINKGIFEELDNLSI
ncbi:transcriptional pleiotropic repressor [Pilibacter termitis]|uniref:Global transcriptional regulator CodY n=1 Tax=Pilibacter termitis TaxID=263852 RepID=A0A1T4LDJ3_9ENTE|nr:GTP-sensing pleiotropic transcriptional regulator CodY [Pilibacter termitis]SJZ52574.1 transcriptional pleiotropic repressor [Pilibacter termitis]